MQRKDPQKAADYVGSVLKGENCVSGFISLCHPQHLVADVLCDFYEDYKSSRKVVCFLLL